MRRIGVKASMTLERLDEISEQPTPTHQLVIPPGGTPFRCGAFLFMHLEDWQAHCAKRKHSYRGCHCVPVKPPAPPVAEPVQPRITFTSSS